MMMMVMIKLMTMFGSTPISSSLRHASGNTNDNDVDDDDDGDICNW